MKKITVILLTSILFCFFGIARAATDKLTLSLDEAILLAVRNNPNVVGQQLSYITQKFSLFVQQWQFYPHYGFEASASFNSSNSAGQPQIGSHTYSVSPSVSLLTPIGTKFSLAGTNVKTSNYNPGVEFSIEQPLMRGFGRAIVEAALMNAMDSDIVTRLNIEGTLRTTVTDVVNAFLDVITAEKRVMIREQAVVRAERSVTQTKSFIKAGRKAGNELVTVQASLASARAQLENDKNALLQARYALLTAIGIDPNTDIEIINLEPNLLIKKYHLPSLEETKKLTLENDVQYQTEQITLYGQKTRDLITAEDNTRWILNFKANIGTGNGIGGGRNAGFTSLFNGWNQARGVGLSLQIPIDDQTSKQALLNAQIALKQARLALKQDKWRKETSAINGWNRVLSAERSLHFAEDAQKLQEKTYNISYQKYLHGLIDGLELQSAQVRLIEAEQELLSARIDYLKSLVNLDLLIGHTLMTWNVRVRC